ncbi:DUF58 domain-containing protein [Cylindrospermopsis raciborskii]|uniref:DUF58 domain-containing protein n=1 Tax=Cylindrospermopsis raciborskii TaxID=77022 RepID=UPI0008DCB76F|nr:DUF58 domain-containing protein [Cylindrospermopsis raciborskii]NLQ04517.1 DUF58 domain-containing protein [Cylindrospermopsis raciborskii MVCC19]OHY34883.1 hypothetical protein BCV64_04470 [Cylindrospermopsis raciborskii MVCC14]
MIPAKKVYFLLSLAIVISPILSMIVGIYRTITLTLLFDLVVMVLMVVDCFNIKKHRVKISRQLPLRLSIGRENLVILKVESGNVNSAIQIRDYYPTEFPVSTSNLIVNLPPNHTQEVKYTIRPNQRGEFWWGNIQVRQLGNWALGWDNWQIPQKTLAKVYPDLLGLRSLAIRLTLQSSGSITKLRQRGMGTEFAELRNYCMGDDLRLIDWKATARRAYGNLSPLVRVLEPQQEQTLLILLDRGRLMTANVQGLKRYDWGLNTTLSLALAGLHRGDRVGVGVFDSQLHTWIPPERGQNHLNRLIDRLTPIEPVLVESDYLNAITYVVKQQTRRSLVVLITDLVDVTASHELLVALCKLVPRYLPFCVTLRDPGIDKIAHNFSQDLTQAYNRAVSLDLISQREIAFAQLKQQGVLVLDAPANQISEQLVERYLQIKAKNQI